jgi:NADPH:quinone reductase-like Zn-dependent oxidoreductase
VLIRVHASTVSTADARARSLDMPPGFGAMGRLVYGVRGPRQKVLGTECAGVIEAIGEGVTEFGPGDEVFAIDGLPMGGHAEYKRMPAKGAIAKKPSNLTFEEAAALAFGGTTALNFLRKGEVKRGDRVLVNGASGTVGNAVVQVARHLGAEVTGVCGPANVEIVRSLGASRVIDYTREDFAAGGERWDVIIDVAGNAPYARSRRALVDGGRLLLILSSLGSVLSAPWYSLTTKHRVVAGPAPNRPEDMREIAALAERGHFRPLIGARFPLDRIVDAHRLVDTGHKRGSVVVVARE